MSSIKLYFAGSWPFKTLKGLDVRNKLSSYHYPTQFYDWMKITKESHGYHLLDSGAFSVWASGATIDIKKYLSYAKECVEIAKKHNKELRVVNLDVIPGEVGKTSSLVLSSKPSDMEIIDKAAAQGYENLCYFIDNGIIPIHVFHQGESFKWLDKMVEKTDYIGVSPANDLSQKQKRKWIDRTFNYIEKNNIKIKTHGFAVFDANTMLSHPWTSCDAATYRLLGAYGQIYLPYGGFKNPDYSKPRVHIFISDKHKKNVFFEGKVKELLDESGFTYEDIKSIGSIRAMINAKYFLGLEKWINKQKNTNKKKYSQEKLGL